MSTPAAGKRKLDLDPTTRARQALASDPRSSAWVSANAGSGKTFVLSRRVIRLLLAGVDPAKILCLTFTKAAAAQMAKRVFDELGRWTTLPDAELADEIADIEGIPPAPEKLATARRLFARALDTPGGLKIQTIHAFCERLLHQFPFEANVAGHFEVLDERNEAALSAEAQRVVLARAAEEPGGEIGRALEAVIDLVSDATHEASVSEFVGKRDLLDTWIVRAGDLKGAIAELRRELGLDEAETSEKLRADVVTGSIFSRESGRQLVERLRIGGANDTSAAKRLSPFVESTDVATRADALLDYVLKDDGTARATGVATNAVRADIQGLTEKLDAEALRLVALRDRIRTAEVFESTRAMLILADAAIKEYARLKRRRGVLDFNDLVIRTAMLLSRTETARWVQYKLDRGLDHILVDEAQDTSPRQWQVVRALVDDFFSGEGAGAATRSVFAVGDEKQSIFSFQGAVPEWFDRVRRQLGLHAQGAGYDWHDVKLQLSFRSVPTVLDAVDRVFAAAPANVGLTAEPEPTLHAAQRRNAPGRVVMWPLIEPPPRHTTDDWTKPLDYLGRTSPEVQLSRKIAATIAEWRRNRAILDAPDDQGKPRPISAGNILILVRTRGALTDALNRELKAADVPIAGADRLTLTEHIAVMDLVALGRAMLLPEDDLSLAAVLKSPLIGLDEQALYDLAHDRKSRSLWAALGDKAAAREDFATALQRLERWRASAHAHDPHAFYARILGPDGGRAAFLRRLGLEAEDVLDEFLSQALAFEQTGVPSLEGFLDWLIAGETEIKRDPDTLRDEVRVMTVHGAKGLEADIVFLVDNGTHPSISGHDPRLLPLCENAEPDDPGPMVWMRKVGAMPRRVSARLERWRSRSEEEYRRLLYVGMTRARDRLYVVGMVKQPRTPDNRWHKLIERGLESELTDIRDDAGDLVAREWRAVPRVDGAKAAAESVAAAVTVPDWATRAASPAPPASMRLTPSSVAVDDDDAPRAFVRSPFLARDDTHALERGRLVHRLLQSLPDIAPEMRREMGAAYLAAFAETWSENDRAALLTEVMAVLDDARFAEAFQAGGRAEVEIAGRITTARGEATVSGRVDRLAVTDNRVLIVDYKTNRPAPATLSEVPRAYLLQLALYRIVLRRLYPGKIVAGALLWTDTPALMEVPDSALDEAEAALLR